MSCHYILTTFEICILFACHSWWEQQWYIDLFSLYRFISQFTCTCYTIHVFLFYLYLYKKYYINKLCIVCYWCVESRSLSLIMLSLIKLSINMIQFPFFNSLIFHSFPGYPYIQMLGCLKIVRSLTLPSNKNFITCTRAWTLCNFVIQQCTWRRLLATRFVWLLS